MRLRFRPSGRAIAFALVPLLAQSAEALTPYHELDSSAKVVALTPGLAGRDFAALLDRLEAAGLKLPLAVAGAGIVLLDDPRLDAVLSVEPMVTEVLRRELAAPEGAARAFPTPSQAGLLAWWNEGFRVPQVSEELRARAGSPPELCAGARTLENALSARGASLRCGPSGFGDVHFAIGRVVVNLVFPESQGPGTTADWSQAQMTQIVSELARALSWWNLKSDRWARFVLINHGKANTQTEPAHLFMDQEYLYIEDCMASLGFTGSCAYDMVHQLNEATKSEQGGHFAFTQFVLNAEAFPASSALAYAYLGGPHTVALLGNGILTTEYLDRVMAHEIGHIFQAADEYDGGCNGCGGQWGYLNVPNNNCVACPLQEGECVMRGSGAYSAQEMIEMERFIHPCRFTKGMAGLWDLDRNGLPEVITTWPETELYTSLPDTVDGLHSMEVRGRAWDIPFDAPPRFGEPVTINSIQDVEFRVSGRAWNSARSLDGFWSERVEDFTLFLPEVGGGWHLLEVRARNSIGNYDGSAATRTFFVHNVLLRKDFEVTRQGRALFLSWAIEGLDFGSEYRIFRKEAGAVEAELAVVPSANQASQVLSYLDNDVVPGHEYIYRLEVGIPGRGIKQLGIARESAVLPDAAPGRLVTMAPNPSREEFLFTISVPRGPRPDRPGVPNPGLGSPPSGRADEDPIPEVGGGSGDLWREASFAIFDVEGRRIRDLGLARHRESSRFNLWWDGLTSEGRKVPPGVYFLKVDFGYAAETTKLVVLR